VANKKFIIIFVLMALTFSAVKVLTRLETTETPDLTQESFPIEFSGWTGVDIEVSPVELEFLPQDTLFVKRHYTKEGLGSVFLVVVFSGEDRRSIHRPEVCYPSQGWTIRGKSVYPVTLDHPIQTLKTARLDIAYGKEMFGRSEIVLYWFMGNHRITASHLKRVLLMGFDRCFLGRNYRWAFVRISTDSTQKKEQDALEVLQTFVHDLFPLITSDTYRQY
jgi:EpsI family protein